MTCGSKTCCFPCVTGLCWFLSYKRRDPLWPLFRVKLWIGFLERINEYRLRSCHNVSPANPKTKRYMDPGSGTVREMEPEDVGGAETVTPETNRKSLSVEVLDPPKKRPTPSSLPKLIPRSMARNTPANPVFAPSTVSFFVASPPSLAWIRFHRM